MRHRGRSRAAWCLVTVLFANALTGCAQEYDFDREPTEVRTLGHELFKIWKKDAARSPENADAKVQMLDENYVGFVDAVDTIAPEDQLAEVDTFLQNLLKVVDEGILPALTRKIREVLRDAMNDAALLAALATPSGPESDTFVQPGYESNLLGYVTGYPELPRLLEMVARIGMENDGFDEKGQRTFDEPSSVTDMTRVLAQELRTLQDDGDDEPLAVMLRDMALVEDERYIEGQNLEPLWVVLYDERGFPLPSKDGDDLVYPFVDENQDGLADVDAQGRFVLQNGSAVKIDPFTTAEDIDVPVIRDAIGRATVPGGGFTFQYVNLHQTGLGFLLQEFHPLSIDDTAYDMLVAFEAIMGQRTVHTDESGAYEGYAVDHPLSDLTYATIHMMDVPELPSLLRGMAALVEQRPEKIAQLFYAFDRVIEVLNRYDGASMNDEQTLAYDMLPYLREIAENPQLWSDMMAGLRQPITTKTGEALGTLLRYRDVDARPAPGGPYDVCFLDCADAYAIGTIARYECIRECPNDEIFSQPMDFDAPESEQGRSLLQKFLHLIRDTAGVEYRMSVREATVNGDPLPELPPLIVLPGAGEAFLRSIAGMLNLADYVPDEVWTSDLGDLLNLLGVDSGDVASMLATLSPLFGAELSAQPEPHQITRLFNQKDLRFETEDILLDIEDPVCKDHYVMSEHLAYGLFVGEAAGAIDTMHPLAVAFASNDSEHIVSGMFSVLHDHYAGDRTLYKTRTGGQSDMKGANLRSYERALEEMLTDEDLFVALHEFAIAVEDVEAATGLPVEEDLRRFLVHALEPGFTNQRGEDYIIVDDGRTINTPSRMHFMIHAVGEASVRLNDVPDTRKRLRGAIGNVVDVIVGAEKDTEGVPQFKRRGSPAMAGHMMRYMANRAAEKAESGELSQWLTVDVIESVNEIWKSRMMTAMVDLASNTLENPEDKATIDAFVAYQFGSEEGRANLLVAIHALLVNSISTGSWEPVARFIADAIDPDREWNVEPYTNVPMISLAAEMLAKTLQYDPDNTGIFLIHRGLDRPRGGEAPFTVILEMIAAYFSPDPLAEQLETPQDYEQFFDEFGQYMEDDVHGVERLYELVDRRRR